MEEVRSGHSEEPAERHGDPLAGETVWDERVEEMGRRDSTAVFSWLAPDGFPLAVRLPFSLDSSSRRIRVEGEPAGIPLLEGRACLSVHEHEADFSWQRNFQVRGNFVRDERGWSLSPRKLVGGIEVPRSAWGRNREFFRRTIQYRRKAKERLARGPSR
jgi:hypothetical protein